jgi:arsenite methyltransferase
MKHAERSVGDYGLDAPRVVRTVGQLGALGLLVTVIAGIVDALPLMAGAFAFTIAIALVGLWMVRAGRVSKLRKRVALVDRLELSGDDRVLDVGYGRGLLLIEAACRLTDGGRAIGIDVWRTEEHSGNHPDAALDNADVEGVDDRVDISIGDARALPFASEAFQAVLSSCPPQNVGDHDARVHAIREIDRVLAPGGHFVLIGSRETRDYVYALRSCNWTEVRRSRTAWRMFPPVRYITGTKPDPSREVKVVPTSEEAPVVAEREGDDEGEMSAAAAP